MKFVFNGKEFELIMLTVTGSRMYGNAREDSDWDYRGVMIETLNAKLTLNNTVEKIGGANQDGEELCKVLQSFGLDLKDTNDIEIYELKRFITLALDNNPNIMDMLCHNQKNTFYSTEIGKLLLNSKNLFLSKNLKETFSQYALSQLKKIKSHNKWIEKFPETHIVLEVIENNYKAKNIDFDWISDNFGGEVALKTTNENAQNKKSLNEKINWDSFLDGFNDFNMVSNPNNYRLPRLVDYCHPKDLQGKQYDLDLTYVNLDTGNLYDFQEEGFVSLKDFLMKHASFRTFSPSMLTIYTNGKGIITKDGSLNPSDPKNIGNFVCLLSIDQMKFKADRDYINKMWNWKCHRNEKRSELEDVYGYDLKHASHLVRLLDVCKEILLTNNYIPELSGDRLQLVNDIRNGKYSYEEVLDFSIEKEKELDLLIKYSTLQNEPNKEKINDLLYFMYSEFYSLETNNLNFNIS